MTNAPADTATKAKIKRTRLPEEESLARQAAALEDRRHRVMQKNQKKSVGEAIQLLLKFNRARMALETANEALADRVAFLDLYSVTAQSLDVVAEHYKPVHKDLGLEPASKEPT